MLNIRHIFIIQKEKIFLDILNCNKHNFLDIYNIFYRCILSKRKKYPIFKLRRKYFGIKNFSIIIFFKIVSSIY